MSIVYLLVIFFLTLAPGWFWSLVLFPDRKSLSALSRILYSIVLGIFSFLVTGLILSELNIFQAQFAWTGWGISIGLGMIFAWLKQKSNIHSREFSTLPINIHRKIFTDSLTKLAHFGRIKIYGIKKPTRPPSQSFIEAG